MEGRVEVRVAKKWGPVCSDDWTAKDALVVCRHLGFGFALYALKVKLTRRFGVFCYHTLHCVIVDTLCSGSFFLLNT